MCFVEREAYATESLERKWKKGGYIRLLSGLMLAPSTGDLLLKSGLHQLRFPCQPWSNAGKMQKTEDERWLWDDIKRIPWDSTTFLILGKRFGVLMGELTPFLGTWPQSGSMLNGVCSKRPKLVQPSRNRFFFWICAQRGVTCPIQTGRMLNKM